MTRNTREILRELAQLPEDPRDLFETRSGKAPVIPTLELPGRQPRLAPLEARKALRPEGVKGEHQRGCMSPKKRALPEGGGKGRATP
jgi:hypothetical protein